MRAEEIREGAIVLLNNTYQRVSVATLHKGSATTGNMIHVKLRNLQTGSMTEQRFAPDDKIQAVDVSVKEMEFLYIEGESVTFMDPETYEQISLPKKAIGPAASYLTENTKVPMEFDGNKPIGVVFPEIVEIRVKSTGPGVRGQADSTYKPATLENDSEIMVPQFIETGDLVKVEVDTSRYIERVKLDKRPSK